MLNTIFKNTPKALVVIAAVIFCSGFVVLTIGMLENLRSGSYGVRFPVLVVSYLTGLVGVAWQPGVLLGLAASTHYLAKLVDQGANSK